MKITILLPFLLLVQTALAETPYFSIQKVNYADREWLADLNFPIFSSLEAQHAAKKINDLLQLTELRLLVGYEEDNIFEKVFVFNENHKLPYGKRVMEYTIHSNNERVLSLDFQEAANGMTSHYFTNSYTFNAQNGDLLRLQDVFTESGFEVLKKMVLDRRKKQYPKEVIWPNMNRLWERDELETFNIKGDNILLHNAHFFPKGIYVSETDAFTTINLQSFKPYLSLYGRLIFGLGHDDLSTFQPSGLPQLFYGKIDEKYEIVMYLTSGPKDEISGFYAYRKYGVALWLAGKSTAGKIKLKESEQYGSSESTGYFDFTLKYMELEGSWSSADGERVYEFRAGNREIFSLD